ncbi:TonB-dependent receptor [Hymenobacter sp. 5317J-9]|uniref:TonB-dependent receptor n=1 Tax=Hymenobacter sp. 5317J-9 TaxID=2932250 RepID=UPI001FD6801B|nr:TonB-dependent receptor [Hymenobacter sp. 5317J-9]UOQ98633.1 TonB-dependent receptor [Hymenobacter sp. 5317J-9]
MKTLYRLVILFICCMGSRLGLAQQAEPLISGSFQDLSVEELARQLEARSGYRIYFDSAAVRGVTVRAEVREQTVASVLRQALQPTALRFSMDADRHVFITKDRGLPLVLPAGFFETLTAAPVADSAAVANRPVPVAASPSQLYEIGRLSAAPASGRATLTGHVRSAKTGGPVAGATVYVDGPGGGMATDAQGYYALTLPVGPHVLNIRGIGIKNTRRRVLLLANGQLDVQMEEDVVVLKEVVVEAEKTKNVTGMQIGVEKLDIKTMRQVPTAFGETDVMRVVLMLPGVKSVGEGSNGISVRGGGTDQNLILFNDATIYNPSHLFGFFSGFNPAILKSVELYKTGIPAKYGGRLSSVLDITTREGNKQKFAGAGGIGLLTSHLALEGPIVKDKTSFLVSGRTSYSDWLLGKLPSRTLRESSASFYDVNAQVNHTFDPNNALSVNGYVSRDRFKFGADTTYAYQNRNGSVKWRHTFGSQLFGVLTGTYSRYDYQIESERNPVNASVLRFDIEQLGGQADFSYFHSSAHTVDFGGSTLRYGMSPGSLQPRGDKSLVVSQTLAREQAQESALYVSDRWDVTARFSVYLGLRYSYYQALGPRDVYRYEDGRPRSPTTVLDTMRYGSGRTVATYHGPEYRASLKYALNDNSSVKAAYNRTRQYIHQLTNTASVSPTDTWKLSDAYVRPQVGDQVSVGYYRNFKANTIETSVETYYKVMQDFLDYKGGAKLLLNPHLETDVVSAKGKAYGVEVSVRKTAGKVNGWLNYTYARTLAQVNPDNPAERINGGNYYPSNYDKPHEVNLAGNYRFSKRFSTSVNFNYSTGRPITLPLSKYYIDGTGRVYYSDRNAYRVPDYYRVDFSMNIEGNHRIKKLAHSSWTVAVYNLTGRSNPYSVYFKSVGGQIKGYQLSIFAQPIPTVTYNFKF